MTSQPIVLVADAAVDGDDGCDGCDELPPHPATIQKARVTASSRVALSLDSDRRHEVTQKRYQPPRRWAAAAFITGQILAIEGGTLIA